MDMLRAERLQRITAAEDAARSLREHLRGLHRGPSARELMDLADAVAQGFQAIREQL
jgi:hypothetical protein